MSHLRDEGKTNMDNNHLMKVFNDILHSYYRAISGKETKKAEQILSKIRTTVLLHGTPEVGSVFNHEYDNSFIKIVFILAVYTVSTVRWDTYFPVNRVENHKLNQTAAPNGSAAVWLIFWF